jgi:hypothetical protein
MLRTCDVLFCFNVQYFSPSTFLFLVFSIFLRFSLQYSCSLSYSVSIVQCSSFNNFPSFVFSIFCCFQFLDFVFLVFFCF